MLTELKEKQRKSLLQTSALAFALISISAVATPASAQNTGQEASDDEDSNVIVVTARRRDENLQDTPIAISAFSGETLEQRQIVNTQDLEKITPNLQFKPAGQLSGNSAASVVFIRGIGQLDPTAAVDPGVGIYVDEVYVGRAVGGTIDFGDIAGVEVLRGPQGTLFGRNTIGGAVLVRTQQPILGEFSGKARVRVGDDDLYEGFAALNIPLGDMLATRISGGLRKRDGYVRRVFDGVDLGNDDSFSVNFGLKWEPSDEFELFLRGDYNKRDENGAPFTFAEINENAPVPAIVSVAAGCPGATIPFAPLMPGDPRFGAPFVPAAADARCANDAQALDDFTNGGSAFVTSESEVWGIAGTAIARLTDEITLKSITSYRETSSRGARDPDNTPLDLISTDLATDSQQFSQEIQFQFDFGNFNAILGGYYFNETTLEEITVPLAFPPAPPFIASLLAGGPGSRDLQISDLETDSIAIFGEASIEVADGLEISGGLRYTKDRKTYLGNVQNIFPATLPNPDPLATLAILEGGPLFLFYRPFKDSFSALTGSASIRYSFNDEVSAYASFARSFKSGGFNTRYNAPPPGFVPVSFDEESVNSYEVGVKMNFGDVRINAAVFQADYEDIQLIFRQGVVPLLFNAGKARYRGAELELSYRPAWGLVFDASLSHLDDDISSVTLVPGATATIAPGDELPLTPSFQGSFGVAYPFELGGGLLLTPRFDGTYSSAVSFITGSVPSIAQDGYFTADATLSLEDEDNGWKLTAGVKNLFDERYLIQGNASLATLGYAERIFARPRNWYVQLSYDF